MTFEVEDVPPRCPHCGSDAIQALLWVDARTGKVLEDGDDFETDAVCHDCDEGFRISALWFA